MPIQFSRNPLERRIRALARTQGRRLSRRTTIASAEHAVVIEHPRRTVLLDAAMATGNDGVVLDHALDVDALGAHGDAWERELRRRRIPVDEASDASRIVHPLLLRLAMEDGLPRGIGPSSWHQGRPSLGLLRDVRFLENRCGAWIAQRFGTDTQDGRTVSFVALDPDRPPRIRVGIPAEGAEDPTGRPLSSLIPLPDTGDEEVDHAYASLHVEHADVRPDAVCVTLIPARWIGWSADPSWREWHAMNPYFS